MSTSWSRTLHFMDPMAPVQGYPTQKQFAQCCLAYGAKRFNTSMTLMQSLPLINCCKYQQKQGKDRKREMEEEKGMFFLNLFTILPIVTSYDENKGYWYYFLILLTKSWICASKSSKASIILKAQMALCAAILVLPLVPVM